MGEFSANLFGFLCKGGAAMLCLRPAASKRLTLRRGAAMVALASL
jgi:hypothetical protein